MKEAPKSFKKFYPRITDTEKLNQARAKAFIHLFLKVRFGVLDFSDRQALICDGTQDGGVDAYYIDEDNRVIYLVQSKFRTSEKNFEEKSINVSELLRMEVGRISKGEQCDSNGHAFSPRITAFQKQISNTRNIVLYNWKVILLANLHKVNDEQVRRLIDGMEYELFDFSRTYRELVFPLTTGTYFKPSEIVITINLGRKTHPQLSQDVDTPLGPCNVRMIYVPIIEIAKITVKYKNSLLRYNPRNYLSLKKNEVNKSIRDTVLNTSHNEFSLRNNGITVLAEYSSVTDRTGVSGEGQLIIKDPQILNGGQTATTLAMILEDEKAGTAVFGSKEVLLKIIEKPSNARDEDLMLFIETISDATNRQSRIVEADRRANDPKMLQLQNHFFDNFGLFLERKRGEFQYGLDSKAITKKDVVDRVFVLRAVTAYDGAPSKARSSEDKMFEEESFDDLLNDFDLDRITRAYFTLQAIEEKNNELKKLGASTISYGKYTLLYATAQIVNGDARSKPIQEQVALDLTHILSKWGSFEEHVKKLPSNAKYVQPEGFNYDGYYKGSTVSDDVVKYDWT
jgi:hypothetical protein